MGEKMCEKLYKTVRYKLEKEINRKTYNLEIGRIKWENGTITC